MAIPIPGVTMKAYSQDLRDRALAALERGEGPSQIARRLEVSREWIYKVRQRFHNQGLRTSGQMGGYRRSCLLPFEGLIRSWIADDPGITLSEMVERLERKKVFITASTLWDRLKAWGLTYKKKSSRQRAGA
jgi:transposase